MRWGDRLIPGMVLRPSYRIQCCSLLEDWVCLGLVVQIAEVTRSVRVDFSPSRPHIMFTANNANVFQPPQKSNRTSPYRSGLIAPHHQLAERYVLIIPTRIGFMKGSKQRLVASQAGGGGCWRVQKTHFFRSSEADVTQWR